MFRYVSSKSLVFLFSLGIFTWSILMVSQSRSQPVSLPQSAVCQLADRISVKVWIDGGWGTGIIFSRQENIYTVVTNDHVVDQLKEDLKIQTFDGFIYHANLIARYDLDSNFGTDLAVIQFRSSLEYLIPELASWDSEFKPKVMGAGYPLGLGKDDAGFVCTELVPVSIYLPHPLLRGYQLGFFAGIQVGMSGGPLLDEFGKVVGINGQTLLLSYNPNYFRYRNGTLAFDSLLSLSISSSESHEILSKSSWAIPIESFAKIFPVCLGRCQ